MISKLKLDYKLKHLDFTNTKDAEYMNPDEDLMVYDVFSVDIKVNDKKFISRNVCVISLDISQRVSEEQSLYIYNCSCGIPGCAGIWSPIKVSKTIDHIFWKMNKDHYDKLLSNESKSLLQEKDKEYILTFERKQYEDEVINLVKTMKNVREENNLPIVFENEGFSYIEDDIKNYDNFVKNALENDDFLIDDEEYEN